MGAEIFIEDMCVLYIILYGPAAAASAATESYLQRRHGEILLYRDGVVWGGGRVVDVRDTY